MTAPEDDQLVNELMPNSSEAIGIYEPEPDDDETQDEIEERATIATALPLMEELLDWFTEQIAACDSIQQVLKTQKLTGMKLEASLNAHDIVRELLESKRDSLIARYNTFKESREEE